MDALAQNYTFGLPIAASTYAAKVDFALHILHWAMLIIFVLWAIFFTYCLVRFRKSRNPNADSNVNKWSIGSFVPDAAILAFELWLIFMFGLPIWSEVKEQFPSAESSTVVELVAEQFAWGFHYAGPDGVFGRRDPKLMAADNNLGLDLTDPAAKDDISSLNNLYVPIGKPTIVNLTSKDVIHSFFIPEFRVKQDIVPGMKTPLWFEATKTGHFELVCAQLCGLGHYRMRGDVFVLAPEEFEAKLKEIKQASLGEEQPS